MKLFGYWRSTSSYRLRIALNIKGIAVEHTPVNLVKDGGEQFRDEYHAVNPAHRVPALVLDDATALTQSLAVIEYLEEIQPAPALLPGDAVARAKIRSFADVIGCDVQPLGNIGVLNHLRAAHGADDAGVKAWAAEWIRRGFDALEEVAAREGGHGPFIFGDGPTLAEVTLVPQMFNAIRFGVDLSDYPRLRAADEAARALGPFIEAAPDNQPDAVKSA